MTFALVAAGIAAYAAFFLCRVRVENGWVGISPAKLSFLRLAGGIMRVELEIGEALLPALRFAIEKMELFANEVGAK